MQLIIIIHLRKASNVRKNPNKVFFKGGSFKGYNIFRRLKKKDIAPVMKEQYVFFKRKLIKQKW